MTEADIITLAKDKLQNTATFTEALSKYTITSDKRFEKIICSCRGYDALEKMEAIVKAYTPLQISGKAFYTILGWLAMEAEELNSFSTGSEELIQAHNQKCTANIIRWRALIYTLLPVVKDFTYEQTFNRTVVDNVQMKFNHDCLTMAIKANDAELLDYFIYHGAPLNRCYEDQDIFGGTLLHVITQSPCAAIASTLIKAGVNAKEKDAKQQTALYYLLKNNKWKRSSNYTEYDFLAVVKVITEAVGITNVDGSLLIDCIVAQNYVIATYLIDNGININVQDKYGRTPMHWTCERNANELMEKLISLGAVYRNFIGINGEPHAKGVQVKSVLGIQRPGENVVFTRHCPAYEAGIKINDIIAAVNGVPVNTMEQLIVEISKCKPCDSANFQIDRQGEQLSLPVIIRVW